MTSHTHTYYATVFDTLARPLTTAALLRHAHLTPDTPINSKTIAQTIASLLSKSVQSGINLSPLIALEDTPEHAESLRIALTALGANVVSTLHTDHNGDITAAHIDTITDGARTVMGLSNTFQASPEATLRLHSLSPAATDIQADTPQSRLHILHSFLPILHAIQRHPLQDSPPDLLPNIHARLSREVTRLTQPFLTDTTASADQTTALQRALLHAVCDLYAAAHSPPAHDINAVWARFDSSLALMDTLVRSIIPGLHTTPPVQPSNVSRETSDVLQTPPVQSEDVSRETSSSSSLSSPAPSAAPAAEPPLAENAPVNPMGFFAKKPDSQPVDSLSAQPSAVAEPPPKPPVAPPVIPPPDTPIEPVISSKSSEDVSRETSSKPDPSAGHSANPMSFFTQKDTDDSEDAS